MIVIYKFKYANIVYCFPKDKTNYITTEELVLFIKRPS